MNRVAIGVFFQEIVTTFLYLTVLELVTYRKIFMKYIKILILLQTYIEFKI